jgi:hypothetical protein
MIGFFSMLVLVSVSAGAINYIQGSANEFITYENSTEGIKIDYPKGWALMRQYGWYF